MAEAESTKNEITMTFFGDGSAYRINGSNQLPVVIQHHIPPIAPQADIHNDESIFPCRRLMQHRILAKGIAFIVMTS